MLIKTRGIVLRAIKYSETSLITDVYTEAKGLQTYIIGGVRKRGAKVKASLLQVMSLLDLVAYYREGRSGMHRIREMGPAYVYQAIPFDIRRSAVGQFMTEVIRRTLHEPEENADLFQFLFENFRWLDRSPHPIANLHLHFLLHLSGYLGFLPGNSYGAEHPCFSLREGIFVEQGRAEDHVIGPPLSRHLQALLDLPRERAHEVPIPAEERRALLRHLLAYYRYHIDNFPAIHSHVILQEVLG